MSTTLLDQEHAANILFANRQLTVVVAASSSACVERYANDVLLDKTTIAAGVTKVFGEYSVDIVFKITCLSGTLAYSQSQSTDTILARATQTNDNAAAGAIGEYLSTTVAVGDAVSETTATPVDVCTLSLTPGDWDVSGVINRVLTGTTATVYGAAISPTANTVPAQAGGSGVAADSSVIKYAAFGPTVTGNHMTAIGPVRVSVAVTTTIHLVAADTFSAGTVGVYGTLHARRVR